MATALTYGVLDAARDGRIYPALRDWAPEARCLFEGPLHPTVERVSPHLAPLPPGSPLSAWWRDVGWGRSWGVVLRSEADLPTLRRHLRTILRVQVPPEGRLVLFRFWDPRVLRPLLPALDAAGLARLFGPPGNGVASFHVEAAEGDARRIATYALGPGGALDARTG